MPGNTVRLVFAGDAKDLDRAASSADRSLMKFKSSVDSVNASMARSTGAIGRLQQSLSQSDSTFARATGSLLRVGQNLGSSLSDGFMDATSKLGKSTGPILVGAILGAAIPAMSVAGVAIGGALVSGFGLGLAALGLAFAAQAEPVKKKIQEFTQFVSNELKRVSKPFEETILKILPMAQSVFSTLLAQFEIVAPALASEITQFAAYLQQAFENLAPAIKPLVDAFIKILDDLGPKLPAIFTEISNALIRLAEMVSNNSDKFANFMANLLRIIPVVIDFISWMISLADWLIRTATAAGNFAAGVWAAFMQAYNAVRQWIGNIISEVQNLPGRIVAAFGNAGSLLFGVGQAMMQGLISGIGSMVGAVASQAASAASNAFQAAKRALGISSPSKLMMQVGQQFGQGFVRGIDATVSDARSAAQRLTQGSVSASFDVAGSSTLGQPASTGTSGSVVVEFAGNVDQAFATAFMKLYRTGVIQLRSA